MLLLAAAVDDAAPDAGGARARVGSGVGITPAKVWCRAGAAECDQTEDAEEKDVSGAITRRKKSSVVWATAAVVCVEKALDVLVRPPEPHPELAWW